MTEKSLKGVVFMPDTNLAMLVVVCFYAAWGAGALVMKYCKRTKPRPKQAPAHHYNLDWRL